MKFTHGMDDLDGSMESTNVTSGDEILWTYKNQKIPETFRLRKKQGIEMLNWMEEKLAITSCEITADLTLDLTIHSKSSIILRRCECCVCRDDKGSEKFNLPIQNDSPIDMGISGTKIKIIEFPEIRDSWEKINANDLYRIDC